MKYRKLRIAFSVVCGVLCLLLVALWLNSYEWYHYISGRVGQAQMMGFTSWDGVASFHTSHEANPAAAEFFGPWRIESEQFPSYEPDENSWQFEANLRFPVYIFIDVPHWFLAFVAANLAAVPWIHWSKRFSLRTLLIATTLVAVVLALIIYASR